MYEPKSTVCIELTNMADNQPLDEEKTNRREKKIIINNKMKIYNIKFLCPMKYDHIFLFDLSVSFSLHYFSFWLSRPEIFCAIKKSEEYTREEVKNKKTANNTECIAVVIYWWFGRLEL